MEIHLANGLDYEQQKELYYLYAIPESKQIIREALQCEAKIDFDKPHAPLLLTAGRNDKLIPSALTYNTYKKYAPGDSVTDYIEFKAHNHLVFGTSTWRQQADVILHWLQGLR